jgi:peptide/nickel transport system substrate-binding protein
MQQSALKVVAVAVAAALGVAACSTSPTAHSNTAKPVYGGNLVMARADDLQDLLPPETSNNADIWVLQQIYEGLVVDNSAGTGVEPLLATSWTTSTDGLTWTFAIRQGVTFQSGQSMTASDVAWSLNYDRTPSTANQWSSLFTAISSIDATNNSTVVIHLSAQWPGLLESLALFAMVIYPTNFGGHPAAYMETHTDGTGPFELKDWITGQSLTIVKNPHYWEKGLPYLNSVAFNLVPTDSTRALQLESGQADIDEFPAPTSMATLKNTPGIVTAAFPSTGILFININNRIPELSDPHVRRAMSYAIDRQAIINTVLSGYGTPANTYLSSALRGHDSSVNGAVYSIAMAKAEMAKSKYPNGLPTPITIELASGHSDRLNVAEIAQQAWAQLGIKATIKVANGNTVVADHRAGNFDTQVPFSTSDVIDPLEMTSFLVLTKHGGINSGYDNPQVYAWAAQAATETSIAAENVLLSNIQQTTTNETAFIPIAYEPDLYAYSSKVHGFSSGTLGGYTLATTWLSN